MAVSEKYRRLFQPGYIGRMWVKNRLVMAPMGNVGMVESDGSFSQRAVDYFVERAKGGVGLIMTGVTFSCTKFDPFWIEGRYFPFPRVDSPIVLPRLNQLAERVHDYDCKLCLQLTAGFGRVAGFFSADAPKPVGPSAVRHYWRPNITLRPLATEEVEELARSFGPAARLARAAGVDAIELHCHEGYLFDQFMTSLWNKRTDKYGGPTLRERMTLVLEALDAIHQATRGTIPVILRFALTHKLAGGRTEEEGLEICEIAENAGAAALDVDAGSYDNWYWPHPPVYQPPACMLDLAAKAKKAVRKIPVMCVGKMYYPDVAARALEEGKADFVVIGRGLLADPEWPNKTREGRVDEIRPCIGCHEACLGRLAQSLNISCAVNPACGNEQALRLTPAASRKKVVVVGGGPAGMEAARVASLRGHDVTLYEKSGELGGLLLAGSVPDFKSDLRLLRKYYVDEVKRSEMDVRLNTEATVEQVLADRPDAVFVATGAVARVPAVPGIDSAKVAMAVDVLKSRPELGKNVVVVGAGLVGCELSVYLAQQGHKVTLVEMLPRILADTRPHANREMLTQMLKDNKVVIFTNTALDAVTGSGVRVVDRDFAKRELAADSVVIAVGLTAQDKLSDALRDKVDEVYRMGDCVAPGKIMDAIWQAYGRARTV